MLTGDRSARACASEDQPWKRLAPPTSGHWRHTAADLIALFHPACEPAALRLGKRARSLRGRAHRLHRPARAGQGAGRRRDLHATRYSASAGRITPVCLCTRSRAGVRDLFHPQTREDVLQALADELTVTPGDIERLLFADRPAEYLLTDVGPEWSPDALIARYNLELARGVLYWASQMTIDIHDGYKEFWRYLKLFKLMFWAHPTGWRLSRRAGRTDFALCAVHHALRSAVRRLLPCAAAR